MKNKKKVIIIGGGFGGLATAALLGKEGLRVTVLEKNDQVGGRAMVLKKDGFVFDLGPSWYLMPDAFDHFFSLFGKKPSDFFTLKRLNPQYRAFFGEKDFVDVPKDIHKTLELFEQISPGSSILIKEYMDIAKYQYEVAMDKFVYKNYDSFADIFDPKLIIEGTKLKLFKNLEGFISQYTDSSKIQKILQYTTVFLGGSPKNTPAFYSIMSHVDFYLGVFYPMGGINRIVQALVDLCKTNNVHIVTNQNVKKILVKEGQAYAVKTADETYEADIVVSNADYPHTEMHLLSPTNQTYTKSYWEKKTLAPSAFFLFLGIKGKLKSLKHHNLTFAHNWEEHFDQIFDNPQWPDNPSYYISCPSKTDPSVAPKGHENIAILLPVASGLDDTDKVREQYADKLISHIESLEDESIRDRIVVKHIQSLREYKRLYHAYKGTALSLAHTLFQTAIFRPKNKSAKVDNLYYVGQYTNPGVGLPMCLISAQLSSRRIIQDS